MIDWNIARTLATTVAGAAPAAELEGLEEAAAESAELVSRYTGLVAEAPIPAPEALGRPEWIEVNLEGMRHVLSPVADRAGNALGPLKGPASGVVGLLLGAEIGVISGLLAQRVLGQYEFGLLAPASTSPPPRLLFVAPNLVQAAENLDSDRDELVRWVALHETTHALQFGGVPWLRGHMAGLVEGLLDNVELNPLALRGLPDVSDLRALVDRVREGGIAALAMSPAQQESLDAIQATMALIEGHAEHVMDAVGAEILPNLDALREGLERRRDSRPPLWRVIERLLGLDMKMRQYRQGKAFCDAVVSRGGIAGLNQAWSGPEALPTLAELDDPLGWLDRVLRSAA